jgi:surfactin synthase thioesterase subunit
MVRAPQRKASAAKGAWGQEVARLSPPQRLEAALETVRAEVARVLSLAGPQAVAADRPLMELGLDSLTAMQLRNALCKRVDEALPATLAFTSPTCAAIAATLLDLVPGAAPKAPSRDPRAGGVSPANSWLRVLRPNERANVRLFCFPGMGGSASQFVRVASHVAAGVEIIAIQPPARADTIDEGAVVEPDHLLACVVEALSPYLDVPALFMGHSFGAIVAHATLQRIAEGRHPSPPSSALAVCCSHAPTHAQAASSAAITELIDIALATPNDAVGAKLVEIGLWPSGLPLDRDFLARFLTSLRADLRLAMRWRPTVRPTLEVPVLALAATRDHLGPDAGAMELWRGVTNGPFAIERLNASHALLSEQPERVAQALNALLTTVSSDSSSVADPELGALRGNRAARGSRGLNPGEG